MRLVTIDNSYEGQSGAVVGDEILNLSAVKDLRQPTLANWIPNAVLATIQGGREALAVDDDVFERMLDKGRERGMEVRGPVDHGFCRSIYFRDPNGYIVELTADTGVHQEIMNPALSKPHEALSRWQTAKAHR
jgi:catechol-2,3-dioxygenase